MNPPQFLVRRKKRRNCSSSHVPVLVRLVPVLLSFEVLIPWVDILNFLCFIFEERRKKWLQLRKRRRNQPRKQQKRNKTPEPFKPALSSSFLLYGQMRQVFFSRLNLTQSSANHRLLHEFSIVGVFSSFQPVIDNGISKGKYEKDW